MRRATATTPGGSGSTNRRAPAYATTALLCAALALHNAFAQAASPPSRDAGREPGHGHGDPFFPLTNAARASCPAPLGPRPPGSHAGNGAAHRRAKPVSDPGDAGIAAAVSRRLHDAPALAGTTLWITVQRRFVYADGCVPDGFDRLALQRQLESVDAVERVFVRVTADPRAMLPYPSAAPPR